MTRREIGLCSELIALAHGEIACGQIVVLTSDMVFAAAFPAMIDFQQIVLLRRRVFIAKHMDILVDQADAGKDLIDRLRHASGCIFCDKHSMIRLLRKDPASAFS